MGRDQQIHHHQGDAKAMEICPQLAIDFGHLLIKGLYGEHLKQITNQRSTGFRQPATRQAKADLCRNDGREAAAFLCKPLIKLGGAALQQQAHSVGVEHEALLHGQSRSWAGPGVASRSARAAKPSEAWGSLSSRAARCRNQSNGLERSGRKVTMPVSGSRSTSTSVPSNRQLAGRRTA
jgi:hypothetical protein